VDALARPVTGGALVWQRDPAAVERARAETAALARDGLRREEAIRIALLQNRALQATFEQLGIAEAALVQAGLLTNPSLSVILAFPLDLGDASVTLLGVLS